MERGKAEGLSLTLLACPVLLCSYLRSVSYYDIYCLINYIHTCTFNSNQWDTKEEAWESVC